VAGAYVIGLWFVKTKYLLVSKSNPHFNTSDAINPRANNLTVEL